MRKCGIGLMGLLAACVTMAQNRPNLIFIMADDLGYGQCGLYNDDLAVGDFDPFFTKLVAGYEEPRQAYTPEEALEFSKRAMPSLRKLGEGGVVFTRAFSPSSLCAPARLSIATGRYPQKHGAYENVDVVNGGLQPGTHLAERLHEAGYACAHIGKWHIAKHDDQVVADVLARHGINENPGMKAIAKQHPDIVDEIAAAGYEGSVDKDQNPLRHGFDYYFGYNHHGSPFYDSSIVWENYGHAGRQSGYNTEVFTDKAIGFIDGALTNGRPFFVQLHYHAMHDLLQPNAPDKYVRHFNSTSYDLGNFYGHLYALDANIQRLVDFLKDNGALDNTLIVFTSDNGAMAGGPSVLPGNAPFSGHKGTFNQGGIRVPLLCSWPAGIKQHRVLDQLVSSMDILPTFLGAAGLDVPQDLDGKSLLPLLATDSVAEVRQQMRWAGIDARRWGFLINTSFKNYTTEVAFAPGGWAMLRGDYVLRFVGSVEPQVYRESPDGAAPRYALYDYVRDPAETTDLKEQMPEMVESLKAEYEKQTLDFAPPVKWNAGKWKEISGQSTP